MEVDKLVAKCEAPAGNSTPEKLISDTDKFFS